MSEASAPQLMLPASVISRVDMTRLVRDLEAVDDSLEAQKARREGESGRYRLPNMSQVLNDFLTINKLDIMNDRVRMDLKSQLRKLKEHAPVLHMTFATEADPESLQQLAAWIRRELHPLALISVGLQPSLVGGVYLRTPNHVHDFSLRNHMKDSRQLIVTALDKLKETAQ